jgi:hypothetical protein
MWLPQVNSNASQAVVLTLGDLLPRNSKAIYRELMPFFYLVYSVT